MTKNQNIITGHKNQQEQFNSKLKQDDQLGIEKVVIDGTTIRLGKKYITPFELRAFSENKELMVLGLVASSGELVWETAPDWDFLEAMESITMYRVTDPNIRTPKQFKALPVNMNLPYFSVECESNINSETRLELETFKTDVLVGNNIYYELIDKSGELMKCGTCCIAFLDKLKKWAESIGGTFYAEVTC